MAYHVRSLIRRRSDGILRLRRAVLAPLALAAAGVPLVAATTGGITRASAASAPEWSAYVGNSGSNNVTTIDTGTNRAGATIGVGMDPRGIAITPDGTTAYVVNDLDNSVTPIHTATNAPGTSIGVGSFPIGVAITPDGKTAYVANFSSNDVTPINTATNTAGTAIKVGTGPQNVAITPDGKTAYVTNFSSNDVTTISTATNTPGTTIKVGTNPRGIAITPDGKTAYVANEGSNDVTPIVIATNTASTAIGVGTGPERLAITPDGKTAYVANIDSNNVTPINTATNTAGTAIGVGTQPLSVAVTPDSKTAYVTNGNSNNVTPIDTATNTAGTVIGVGSGPDAIAITPDQAPVAHLSVTPAHAGAPTHFDASASTVAFGTIASYAWNFGDGSTATTTTPTTTHTYALAGTFTASVTETSSGGTSTTTKVFTGQTMSKNGGPSAVDTRQFTVPATVPPGAGVATSAQFGVPNQTDLFDVNNNGAVEVRWVEGGGAWNGPLVISPPGLAPPGAHLAASNQSGLANQTDVFVVGNNGATRVLWVRGAGKWQGPLSITPAANAAAGAALAASNQFGISNQTDVFVVAKNGATDVSWVASAGAWQGPMAITPANTAPAGAHLATSPQFGVLNQTDVFVVGGDGATRVSWVHGAGAWNGPLRITPTNHAPAGAALAASNQFGISNQTDVFVVANNGATDVSWVASTGAWKGPMAITPTNTAPAGAHLATSPQFGVLNQTDVFIVDNIGATRVSWVDGAGAWNGPLAITAAGNAPRGAHLAASSQFGAPNQTDVFVVNTGGFAQVSWVESAGAWKGPLQV